MTLTLRPNWRDAFGPLDMKMPTDAPPTMVDWNLALEHHMLAAHEDSEDRLNPDGTWGPPDVGAPGGSGICFGYSTADLSAVLVAEGACHRRERWYDWEHWVRQIRYSIAAWEMTHDTKFARRIANYDNFATGVFSDTGVVHLDDPGWVPFTLAQYNAMAKKYPGQGLPWNCRAVGWIAYGRAMRHKCDRLVTPNWAQMLLHTCELAAHPETGQLGHFNNPGDPLHSLTYTFHEAILIHAVLCLCKRTQRTTPRWVYAWMESVGDLPPMDYGGWPSPPSYWTTVDGRLVAYQGPQQHGDPAHGWWGSNCIALHSLTGDVRWLEKASLYGPYLSNRNEQERKQTMLARGLLG